MLTDENGWEPAVYMSCMSQHFRLFHVSNLSVRNFRIFLLMYTGSLISPAAGPLPSGAADVSPKFGQLAFVATARLWWERECYLCLVVADRWEWFGVKSSAVLSPFCLSENCKRCSSALYETHQNEIRFFLHGMRGRIYGNVLEGRKTFGRAKWGFERGRTVQRSRFFLATPWMLR